MNGIEVITASGHKLFYDWAVAIRITGDGALRVYTKGRFFNRQRVYHPATEWRAINTIKESK